MFKLSSSERLNILKKVLLLDIENISKAESKLAQYCSEYHRIYVVYANFNVKFSLDELLDLVPFILKDKLKIIKMAKTGKDSADFGLAFLAGQLSRKKKREFHIMSNDHSMEYIVDLLDNSKHKTVLLSKNILNPQSRENDSTALNTTCVEQSNSIMSIHESSTLLPITDIGLQEENIALNTLFLKYCKYLHSIKNHRPVKIKKLINSIKSQSNDEKSITPILNLLMDKKIVTFSNTDVIYNDVLINSYLQTGQSILK